MGTEEGRPVVVRGDLFDMAKVHVLVVAAVIATSIIHTHEGSPLYPELPLCARSKTHATAADRVPGGHPELPPRVDVAIEVSSRRLALVASVRMSSRSERQAAREEVAAYHEARLAELVQRVGEAVDRLRAGELDAFEVDEIIFQYSRSAKELWKFCNIPDVVSTAHWIRESPPVDWWERGAPKRR